MSESNSETKSHAKESEASATPKIYVFSNVGGGDGECLALAEDGVILGSHWCSHEEWAKVDLGVMPGTRLDRHEVYRKHYPDGYEMEFVPNRDIKRHKALQAAFDRCRALPEKDKTEGDNFARVEIEIASPKP